MLSIRKIKRKMRSKDGFNFTELKERYERDVRRATKWGDVLYNLAVIIYLLTDGFNYFTGLYLTNDNLFVYLLIGSSITLFLNLSTGPIGQYFFLDENELSISPVKRKIIRIIIIFTFFMMFSLIIIHFYLRMKTLYTKTEEMPEDTARALTYLVSMLPLATSIGAFLLSSINKVILVPLMIKYIKKRYVAMAEYVKSVRLEELQEQKLSMNSRVEDRYAYREHNCIDKIIRAEMTLKKELHNSGRGGITLPGPGKTDDKKVLSLFGERKVN